MIYLLHVNKDNYECHILGFRHKKKIHYIEPKRKGYKEVREVCILCASNKDFDAIKDAVRHHHFTENSARFSLKITYKGTSYKKRQFLVTGNYDLVVF